MRGFVEAGNILVVECKSTVLGTLLEGCVRGMVVRIGVEAMRRERMRARMKGKGKWGKRIEG
jgi:hypothetical protein